MAGVPDLHGKDRRDIVIPRDLINRRKNLYLTLVAVGFSAMAILAFAEKYMPKVLFKSILYVAISLFLSGTSFCTSESSAKSVKRYWDITSCFPPGEPTSVLDAE